MARTVKGGGGGGAVEVCIDWDRHQTSSGKMVHFHVPQGASAELAIWMDCNATVIQATNWT